MTTAAIVGSGPNGLAAAVTLAAAGLQVTVYEANERIGGGTRSSELTLPGLVHDECSGFHPLGIDTPFSRSVDLAGHGLRYLWPEVQYSNPLDSTGRGGVAFRSVVETADKLSDNRWSRIFGPMAANFAEISEEILQPIVGVPERPLSLARFGARAALPAAALAKVLSTPESKALWAGVAAHAFRPFSSPFSSSIGMALASAGHTHGWPVAEGGSKSITDAMASIVRSHGGRIETGRMIASLAELESPTIVMLDTSPRAAVSIAGAKMAERVAKAYRSYRHGPAAFKMDFAVEGGVPWLHPASRRAGTVHLGGTYEEISTAEKEVCAGRMPERPFVLVGQQYLADPDRSHNNVHPVYSYAHVPAGYTGDATDAIIAQFERFAPGFRDRVLATHVRSAPDMARYNANYIGGDIVTGANDPRQLVFRPYRTLNPYETGIDGVYICSAATPPGAGAHGMCGYNAAKEALAAIGM
ncbi:MAG: NAD(P)/FAD-dependent oxidoreductase [Acidimicrobiales bacterium]|nr:NAD(P)/FAD-dependent oxidoreductase [Acidimicrobiales bacterium]